MAELVGQTGFFRADPFVKQNIEATPTIGLALDGGRRDFVMLGVIDAQRLARIVPLLAPSSPSMPHPPSPAH